MSQCYNVDRVEISNLVLRDYSLYKCADLDVCSDSDDDSLPLPDSNDITLHLEEGCNVFVSDKTEGGCYGNPEEVMPDSNDIPLHLEEGCNEFVSDKTDGEWQGNPEGMPYKSVEDMIHSICFDLSDLSDLSDDDNDMIPEGHPIYHPSNLNNIQQLLNNSERRSDFLDPELIMKIIPRKDLLPSWLKEHEKKYDDS